jgi:hypothetical protein
MEVWRTNKGGSTLWMGRDVDGSPFNTCEFSKNYEVNLHTNLDDDDYMCLIIWLKEAISSNLG